MWWGKELKSERKRRKMTKTKKWLERVESVEFGVSGGEVVLVGTEEKRIYTSSKVDFPIFSFYRKIRSWMESGE